jgi:Phage integrase, N-terminal SAM-like domain
MDSSRPKQAAPQPRSKNTPKEHARSVAPVSNKTTDEQTGERGARSRLVIVPLTEEQYDEEQAPSIKRGKTARLSHLPSRRQTQSTLEQAIEDYLHDHEGGNHSHKTLEWHRTALTLLHTYLHTHRGITLVEEVDAPDISAWFTHMRKTPGRHGKIRSERTIQTYARSVRAFFHWLVRQGTVQDNPFDRVVFPKVGKPLIQTITDEEFERLLQACTLPTQSRHSLALL